VNFAVAVKRLFVQDQRVFDPGLTLKKQVHQDWKVVARPLAQIMPLFGSVQRHQMVFFVSVVVFTPQQVQNGSVVDD
jgi:hypothetical protein